ncbi:hypothetical protein [Roseococcus pinisoli]|uniref:Uncharacterized protein n=1 Tax=Roseococcus pinisoli TaxID=2835040 RepID=A0ABS5QI99_9PROT|nr:hypothetical protein [Roseococcus pinisoli]MBS7812268.1 hypothetical protein [Roseococcus pinisoli]
MSFDPTPLIEAAKKAGGQSWRHKGKDGKYLSPGDWEVANYESAGYTWVPVRDGKRVVALVTSEDVADDPACVHDAAHIAASNPAAILAWGAHTDAQAARIAELEAGLRMVLAMYGDDLSHAKFREAARFHARAALEPRA